MRYGNKMKPRWVLWGVLGAAMVIVSLWLLHAVAAHRRSWASGVPQNRTDVEGEVKPLVNSSDPPVEKNGNASEYKRVEDVPATFYVEWAQLKQQYYEAAILGRDATRVREELTRLSLGTPYVSVTRAYIDACDRRRATSGRPRSGVRSISDEDLISLIWEYARAGTGEYRVEAKRTEPITDVVLRELIAACDELSDSSSRKKVLLELVGSSDLEEATAYLMKTAIEGSGDALRATAFRLLADRPIAESQLKYAEGVACGTSNGPPLRAAALEFLLSQEKIDIEYHAFEVKEAPGDSHTLLIPDGAVSVRYVDDKVIRDLISDQDATVRAVTVSHLDALQPKWHPSLRGALKDVSPEVRVAAIDVVMHSMKWEEVVPGFANIMVGLAYRDPSETVRIRAVEALNMQGLIGKNDEAYLAVKYVAEHDVSDKARNRALEFLRLNGR